MMNAGTGHPRRALVRETAVTIGSAPRVIPPTASGRSPRSSIAQKSRPVRTAPSASSVLCLQSM